MATPEGQRKRKRYYVSGTIVPFEEDYTHEFKGHTNICEEEIPHWAYCDDGDRRTRAPVSRAINAFLNSGAGGIVYMGIIDSGMVMGLHLTQFTKDHLVVNIEELLTKRYMPPVDLHRYRVRFVPVVDKDATEDQIDAALRYDSKSSVDPESRKRDHTLQTSSPCWCHNDCKALLQHGRLPPQYVVEIHVLPWNPEDPRNARAAVGQMKTFPIHQDELGKCYFRRQASVVQYSNKDLAMLAEQTVAEHYEPQIQSLKAQINEVQSRLGQET